LKEDDGVGMKKFNDAVEILIDENYAGDASIFVAAAESFLEGFALSQQDLREAFEARDLTRMAALAHRLKGDTGLFHHKETPKLFQKIDMTARAGQLSDRADVNDALLALHRLADELKVAIKINKQNNTI
jgi:hypothetical protein